MIRTTLLVLLGIVCMAGTASANGLIYKSTTPTGYAWVLEHGNMRQVPCYRTIRDIDGARYVRNRECDSPAQSVSDIALPLRSSGRTTEARHFRILSNGNIRLY